MSYLKDYKEKDCKTLVGKFFQRLVFTWAYKIITAVALVLIASIAFNFTKEGSFWEGLISSIYGVGFIFLLIIAVVMVVYAWIINPISSLLKKRKEKRINKE